MNELFTISPTSRFVSTPIYQEPGNIKFWGPWVPIDFPNADDDRIYTTRSPNEGVRIDLTSFLTYQSASYWWVICQANNISNPFFDLTSRVEYAHTCDVIGSQNVTVMRVHAKKSGTRYNTGQPQGLEIEVYATTANIYVNNVLVETFSNLSPYPLLEGSSEANPNFWGSIDSEYVRVEWLSPYTLRPVDGGTRNAPTPPNGKRYSFFGGFENGRANLRIPSMQAVNKALSNS